MTPWQQFSEPGNYRVFREKVPDNYQTLDVRYPEIKTHLFVKILLNRIYSQSDFVNNRALSEASFNFSWFEADNYNLH